MKRQKLFLALLLFPCLFLTNCRQEKTLTEKLWNPSYKETVRNFLVGSDGVSVVFLGQKYDYVLLDGNGILKRILFSRYRYLMRLDVEGSNIKLHNNSDLTAYLTIRLLTNRPPQNAVNELRALGFINHKGDTPYLKIRLQGQRFQPIGSAYRGSQLSRSYEVEVFENPSTVNGVGKVALTPLTIGADAAIFLGGVLLRPFAGN